MREDLLYLAVGPKKQDFSNQLVIDVFEIERGTIDAKKHIN